MPQLMGRLVASTGLRDGRDRQEDGGDDGRELLYWGVIAKRDRMGVCLTLRAHKPQNIDPNQVVQLKEAGGFARTVQSRGPLRFLLGLAA
jgi:hypothetical protein